MDFSEYLPLEPHEEIRLKSISPGWRTRFAPSPSGYLHLGHLINIIYTWGIAQKFNGSVVLRIEDHDQERSKEEYVQAIQEDLDWFGLTYESSPLQSQRHAQYLDCLNLMSDQIYVCSCSRKTMRAYQNYPQKELWYRGDCKHLNKSITKASPSALLRWITPEDTVLFEDIKLGMSQQTPSEQCGDFSLRDRRGNFSYQFCVVHDDLMDRIDLVIRGKDIFDSTGRQLLLRKTLQSFDNLQPLSKDLIYYHHPLIKGKEGKKLSKTEFAKSLKEWRDEGYSPLDLVSMALSLIDEKTF